MAVAADLAAAAQSLAGSSAGLLAPSVPTLDEAAARLQRVASTARAMPEAALAHVAAEEGLAIEGDHAAARTAL